MGWEEVTGEQYIKALASLVAWREESVNGVSGMLGVLFVIANRAKAKWEMGDWTKIITDKNQFSSMSVLGDGQTIHYPDPRDPAFTRLLQAVDSIYDGTYTTPDITNGALYYADLTSPGFQKGGWFSRVILANPTRFPRCAKIGSTTYFKDLGANYVPSV